jgi:UDP-glucose 4-epimerase
VKGTLNILEACRDRGVERILHTSTSETYGTARRVPMDEGHPLRAQSPYSASKIAADKLAESYHLSFNLPVTTVRPFNTFGPRQSLRGVVPTIMAQALSRRCEAISLGSVEPVRDFTFVGDTARAFCMIAEAPLERVAGRLYNLGTGEGVSVGRLVEMIQALTGTHKPVIQTEERKRPDKSEVLELISDPGRVLREVGWRAETALKEGLRRTLPWVEAKLADSDDVLRHMI